MSISSPCSDSVAPAECGSTGPGSVRSWQTSRGRHEVPLARSHGCTSSRRRPLGQHLILRMQQAVVTCL